MSERTYTGKEDAKSNMEEAILDYVSKAQADGCDARYMAEEIETACYEAGLLVVVLQA